MKLVVFLYAFLVAASMQEFVDRARILYKNAVKSLNQQLKVAENNYKTIKEQVRSKIQNIVNMYNQKSLKKETEIPTRMSAEEFKRRIEELARKTSELGSIESSAFEGLVSEKDDESEDKEAL